MKFYEISLQTNVSPFSVREIADKDEIDHNFLPEWVFHVAGEELPECWTSEDFFWSIEGKDYDVLSNETLFQQELEDFNFLTGKGATGV